MWHDDKHGEGMSVFDPPGYSRYVEDIRMWSVWMFTLGRPGCKDQSVYSLSDEFKLKSNVVPVTFTALFGVSAKMGGRMPL